MWRALLSWCLAACAAPPVDSSGRAAPDPVVRDAWQVIPGDGLPPGVVCQPSHNNLDIAWHQGRLFLAFRTAPDHFASADATLYVVSTTDEVSWRYEGRFHLGTDLREPQLVSWNGVLHLYFAVLGDDPLAFEPQGARHATWAGPGRWTPAEPIFPGDFIPWRIKEVAGRLSVTGYTGGGGVYEPGADEPIRVHWLASDDGVSWEPAVPGAEVVHEGGASETDLVVRADGSVVAVLRNEAGDEDGFGAKVCTAPPDAPGAWSCRADPRKYDSPLLFERGGRTWLIARRTLSGDGRYDLGRDDLSRAQQYVLYQATWWQAPKRCALWEVDPDERAVRHVLDLPSRGDTCFPEAVPYDGELLVYNYTSDPSGPDLSWLEGQRGPTAIWRQVLDFTP